MTGLILTGMLAVSTVFAGSVFAEAADSASLKEIGEKTEGDYEVRLKNSTGKPVKSLAVEIDGEGAGKNMLEEAWADDEEIILYVTPKEMKGEDAKPPVYDIELTFADDTKSVIHTFPFGDADEADILFSDGVAYLKFVSLSLKNEHNTLETEKSLAPKTQTGSTQTAAADSESNTAGSYVEPANNDNYNDYSGDSYNYSGDSYDYSGDSYDYSGDSYDYGGGYDYDYDYDYGSSDSQDYGGDSSGGDQGGGDGCIDDGVILN